MFCSFRCREKQRKEASRLQAVNRKLTAMNKLLMEENDRLQKQVSQLVYENGYFRQHTQNVRKYEFLFIFSSNVRIVSAKTTDIIIQDCIFLLEKKIGIILYYNLSTTKRTLNIFFYYRYYCHYFIELWGN
jgi:hypothetical protein